MTADQITTAYANMVKDLQAENRKSGRSLRTIKSEAVEALLYLDRPEPKIADAIRHLAVILDTLKEVY